METGNFSHIEEMSQRRRLALEYRDHPEQPQVVIATRKGGVVGDYLFTPVPFVFPDTPRKLYYFIVSFYPTGEVYFCHDGISAIETMEWAYQLWKAESLNQ